MNSSGALNAFSCPRHGSALCVEVVFANHHDSKDLIHQVTSRSSTVFNALVRFLFGLVQNPRLSLLMPVIGSPLASRQEESGRVGEEPVRVKEHQMIQFSL